MIGKKTEIVLLSVQRKSFIGANKIIVTAEGSDGKVHEMSGFTAPWNDHWQAGQTVSVEIRPNVGKNGKTYFNLYPTPEAANTIPEAPKMAQDASKPQEPSNVPTEPKLGDSEALHIWMVSNGENIRQILREVRETKSEILALREKIFPKDDSLLSFDEQMKKLETE